MLPMDLHACSASGTAVPKCQTAKAFSAKRNAEQKDPCAGRDARSQAAFTGGGLEVGQSCVCLVDEVWIWAGAIIQPTRQPPKEQTSEGCNTDL